VVGIALGVGVGGTSVGGESEDTGGVLTGAVAGYSTGHVRLLLDAELQPFEVDNPLRAESFRALYLLAAPEFAFGRFYVRPGAGITSFFFRGEDPAESSDLGWGGGPSAIAGGSRP
jgi:hypothetical protein